MALPPFVLHIEKQLGAETWVNRYFLSNPSIESALFTAQAIVDAEIAVHNEVVTFTRYRVSDTTVGTDIFVIVPLSDVGAITHTSDLIPLFNVARFDFPAGLGRPSRKYLRLPLQEGEVENFTIIAAKIATLNSDYGTALGDIDEYVDIDGEPLGTGVCQTLIGMRQLRRGSKRRAAPVLG